MVRVKPLIGAAQLVRSVARCWATASCTEGLPESVAGRVRAHQLRTLFKLNVLMTTATTLVAAVVVFDVGATAPVNAAAWILAIVIFFAGQFKLIMKRRGPPPRSVSPRGIRLAERGAIYAAVVWGVLPALFSEGATIDQRFILALISVGMLFAGALAFASIPRAAIIYSGLTVLILLVHLLVPPSTMSFAVAVVLIVFFAIICGTVVTLGRQAAQHVVDQQLIADAAAGQKRLRDEMRSRETRANAIAKSKHAVTGTLVP